jgi:hypothetical protein
MGIATAGDWNLHGDASGILTVKTRRIDTRNPA